MALLRERLGDNGLTEIATYIQSGNAVVRSKLSPRAVEKRFDHVLHKDFGIDSKLSWALALPADTYQKVVIDAPKGFGEDDASYRYDVIFLMGLTATQAAQAIQAREGVDFMWQGTHVIYYRRPSISSPDATKSYLTKIIKNPIYPSLTMRNWRTTQKLLELVETLGRERKP